MMQLIYKIDLPQGRLMVVNERNISDG